MLVRYQNAKKAFWAIGSVILFSCTCGFCTLGDWSEKNSDVVVSERKKAPKSLTTKPKVTKPKVTPKGLKKGLPPKVVKKGNPEQDKLLQVRDALLKKRASGKKEKDLFRGRGPKVNLYDDDKNGSWDRAKVDLNRDDDWDEKWTVKNGDVERKVISSNKVLLWKNGAWTPKKK